MHVQFSDMPSCGRQIRFECLQVIGDMRAREVQRCCCQQTAAAPQQSTDVGAITSSSPFPARCLRTNKQFSLRSAATCHLGELLELVCYNRDSGHLLRSGIAAGAAGSDVAGAGAVAAARGRQRCRGCAPTGDGAIHSCPLRKRQHVRPCTPRRHADWTESCLEATGRTKGRRTAGGEHAGCKPSDHARLLLRSGAVPDVSGGLGTVRLG